MYDDNSLIPRDGSFILIHVETGIDEETNKIVFEWATEDGEPVGESWVELRPDGTFMKGEFVDNSDDSEYTPMTAQEFYRWIAVDDVGSATLLQ
jgi:hypothetical protein